MASGRLYRGLDPCAVHKSSGADAGRRRVGRLSEKFAFIRVIRDQGFFIPGIVVARGDR